MADGILSLAPTAVAIVALLLAFIYNQKTLKDKKNDDERKEIYKKLNLFYGPLRHYRGTSYQLYQTFEKVRGGNFRMLIALLNGEMFQGNDRYIIEEILKISEDIEKLVSSNSGLIDNQELRDLLAKVVAHSRLIKGAYKGEIQGETDRFREFVFPRQIDRKIDEEINKLKNRLIELNRM